MKVKLEKALSNFFFVLVQYGIALLLSEGIYVKELVSLHGSVKVLLLISGA